jgi:hypothetical protein
MFSIRIWEKEPIKVKVQAYYEPSIDDIVSVFLQANSKQQADFLNKVWEWFEKFNIENPYSIDHQFVAISQEDLSDKARKFIEKMYSFINI